MKKTAAKKATATKAAPKKKTTAKKADASISLGARLRAFIELFAQRRDVHVAKKFFLLGFTTRQSKKYLDVIPPELFAFSHELGETEFTWALAEHAGELEGRSEGSLGGRLSLRSPHKFAYRAAEGWEPMAASITAYAPFDVIAAEGATWVVQLKGKRPVDGVLMFNDDNTNKLTDMGSLEAYFTEGARRAFTWYWQVGDAEGAALLERLLARSVPKATPPETLVEMLVQRGMTTEMAAAMVGWLGVDVVVLLDQR